mmetsp:Transcript_9033/g.17277  ORF Transcript_9033/g.17277 Transcript_9033/m.17277 type:complete len:255 (+) Transcript_9033:785-1549(+)
MSALCLSFTRLAFCRAVRAHPSSLVVAVSLAALACSCSDREVLLSKYTCLALSASCSWLPVSLCRAVSRVSSSSLPMALAVCSLSDLAVASCFPVRSACACCCSTTFCLSNATSFLRLASVLRDEAINTDICFFVAARAESSADLTDCNELCCCCSRWCWSSRSLCLAVKASISDVDWNRLSRNLSLATAILDSSVPFASSLVLLCLTATFVLSNSARSKSSCSLLCSSLASALSVLCSSDRSLVSSLATSSAF